MFYCCVTFHSSSSLAMKTGPLENLITTMMLSIVWSFIFHTGGTGMICTANPTKIGSARYAKVGYCLYCICPVPPLSSFSPWFINESYWHCSVNKDLKLSLNLRISRCNAKTWAHRSFNMWVMFFILYFFHLLQTLQIKTINSSFAPLFSLKWFPNILLSESIRCIKITSWEENNRKLNFWDFFIIKCSQTS